MRITINGICYKLPILDNDVMSKAGHLFVYSMTQDNEAYHDYHDIIGELLHREDVNNTKTVVVCCLNGKRYTLGHCTTSNINGATLPIKDIDLVYPDRTMETISIKDKYDAMQCITQNMGEFDPIQWMTDYRAATSRTDIVNALGDDGLKSYRFWWKEWFDGDQSWLITELLNGNSYETTDEFEDSLYVSWTRIQEERLKRDRKRRKT
jgi:hypothetical protein